MKHNLKFLKQKDYSMVKNYKVKTKMIDNEDKITIIMSLFEEEKHALDHAEHIQSFVASIDFPLYIDWIRVYAPNQKRIISHEFLNKDNLYSFTQQVAKQLNL